MSGRAPISDYLRELAVALPGPRRRRERILAEVEDHLHAHADALVIAGHPERSAVAGALESFGEPRLVAASFAEGVARRSLAVAGSGVALTVAGFAAGVAVLTQIPGVAAASPLDDGPAGVIGFFAVQLAIVAAAIALLRALTLRSVVRADASELALALRANALAVGTAAVALGADAAALAGHWRPGATATASAIVLGVLVAAVLWTLARLAVAGGQVRRLRALDAPAAPAMSAIEQLAVLAERLPAPFVGAARGALGWAAGRRSACIALVAAMPAALLAAASLREHGIPDGVGGLARELLAAAVLFGLELAAVMVCAYGFDRLLGLWPRRARALS
jgi:HAAS